MILRLTISRPLPEGEMGDPNLVISNVPTEGCCRFLLTDNGLGFPTFPYRYNYAPDSDYASGKELLGAVQDLGTLPGVLHVFADSMADLIDAKAELEEALAQPTYTTAIEIDGVTLGPWDAMPTSPNWGDAIDSGLAEQYQTRAALQIPVNPA